MTELYIGLMSGTSMDAIDAALVQFEGKNQTLSSIGCYSHSLPDELRQNLAQLIQKPEQVHLDMLGQTNIALGKQFAAAVNILLQETEVKPEQVTAIGSHGQTIRHSPGIDSAFTLQIGDPNTIAYKTGITTVADFRSMDMSAGGQGAPLAPAFHREVFYSPDENRVILNIGGIANITWLPKDSEAVITGFDTGPGNTLMDTWIQLKKHQPFDRDGAWAATGTVNSQLMKTLLADSYLKQHPPKSTGREHYHLSWLNSILENFPNLSDEDIQASLCQFSVESIAKAIETHYPQTQTVIVCGGGVHNKHLTKQLEARLEKIKVDPSNLHGIDADWVEAIAFAWLARQRIHKQKLSLQTITGSEQALLYGNIYASGAGLPV